MKCILNVLSLLTLLLMGAEVTEASASTPQKRLVLLEEVTNWGCGPCAALAPKLDSMLNVRLGDVVALKYHCWWPTGSDPFFRADSEELTTRISFLNTNSAPTVFIDGKATSGYVAAFDQAINSALEKPVRINFDVTSNLTDDGKLSVGVKLHSVEAIKSSNLRLFVCVIEEKATLNSAPNGEKEFLNSVRKMLPNANGEDLGNALSQIGGEAEFNYEWNANTFYDLSNLGLVAFVQDMTTHEVIETVYAPRNAGEEDGASIVLVDNVPEEQCSPSIKPTLLLRNTGARNLTNMKVNIDVNGYTSSYPWTGDLSYLESESFPMPLFDNYQLNSIGNTNTLKLWLSDINGTNAVSPVKEITFKNSKQATHSVQLTLYTDRKPEETAWKVYDSNDEVVCESEPYTEKRHMYKIMLPLTKDDCYRIEFTDAGGDGIVGNYGNGYYKLDQYLADGSHSMLLQGEYEGNGTTVSFNLKNAAPSAVNAVTAEKEENKTGKRYDKTRQRIVINDTYTADGVKLKK